MQGEGYSHELGNFIPCKLHHLEVKDTTPVHVHNPRKIKQKHGGVVSEPERKKYKVVFKKRQLIDNFDSLPTGTINLF